MSKLNPGQKKLISAAGVAVGLFALRLAATYVVKLPVTVQADALTVIAALVHVINAWGTQEQVVTAVIKEAP